MDNKYFIEIVINKEKLSDGSPIFVAHCPTLSISSQGINVEEAKSNIKEAVELYLEEQPEKYSELVENEQPIFSFLEIKKTM